MPPTDPLETSLANLKASMRAEIASESPHVAAVLQQVLDTLDFVMSLESFSLPRDFLVIKNLPWAWLRRLSIHTRLDIEDEVAEGVTDTSIPPEAREAHQINAALSRCHERLKELGRRAVEMP